MDETIGASASAEPEKSPVLKALRLLAHVATSQEAMSLADLTRALKLPKPTSYRLATALERAGYLRKDPLTRRYVVAEGFENIALGALRNGVSHRSRQLLMDELAERLGTRINIAVLKSGKLLFVEWVESTSPLRVDLRPETHVPVHCSASGKLLLAFGPQRLKETFLRMAPFKALTSQTLVSSRAFQREFDEIQRRGHAEDNEEFLPGVNCLAVPIRNGSGDVVAGLAAMAPVASVPLTRLRKHVPDLKACAERIAMGLPPARARSASNNATSPGGNPKGTKPARGESLVNAKPD